eukprot:747543-Hanusia_phi.AAC.7
MAEAPQRRRRRRQARLAGMRMLQVDESERGGRRTVGRRARAAAAPWLSPQHPHPLGNSIP